MPSEGFTVTDLEGDSSSIIDFGNVVHAVNPYIQEFVFSYSTSWSYIGIPILLNTILYGHNSHASASYLDVVASNGAYNAFDFFKNHLYEFADDTVPMHYKYINDHSNGGLVNKVSIIKDGEGSSIIPEFNFNGIGNLNQEEGYQIKVDRPYFIKLNGLPIHNVNSGEIEASFSFTANQWYLIGYPFTYEIEATAFFASMVASNNLIIAKDYLGRMLWPEFSFDGIGLLKPGQGYLLKTKNIS